MWIPLTPSRSFSDGRLSLPNPNLITERITGAAFASPFAFKTYGQSGLPISELSELGPHADDLCVIRSMYCDVPNHEPSLMMMNCGDNVRAVRVWVRG